MKVLIVSKTRMRNGVCVGGILIPNGKYVRLLNTSGYPQPDNTPFEIGGIWDIEFKQRINTKPPHIEDILVISENFIKQIDVSNLLSFLKKLNIQIWYGNPVNLFDGCLKWYKWQGDTHQVLKGYINHQCIPKNSVGFWIPDKNLYLKDNRYKYYDGYRIFSIKYVGMAKPVSVINKNTLCRVSLARWWDTNGKTENRCYLQLSGFYI